MKYTLRKIGEMTLPRGIAGKALSTLNRRDLRRNGICQDFDHEISTKIMDIFGVDNSSREDGVACFTNIDKHNDFWPDVYVNGKPNKPGFLHVVLAGKFDLTVGTQKMTFKRGDIFVMNPNVDHFVENASKMCSTAVATVPIKSWYNKKELNFRLKPW
jgi:hypothetical protein